MHLTMLALSIIGMVLFGLYCSTFVDVARWCRAADRELGLRQPASRWDRFVDMIDAAIAEVEMRANRGGAICAIFGGWLTRVPPGPQEGDRVALLPFRGISGAFGPVDMAEPFTTIHLNQARMTLGSVISEIQVSTNHVKLARWVAKEGLWLVRH